MTYGLLKRTEKALNFKKSKCPECGSVCQGHGVRHFSYCTLGQLRNEIREEIKRIDAEHKLWSKDK